MKKPKGSRQSLKRELRTFTAPVPLEVRTLADGSKQVSGYAIVFNSRSVDLGGFTEICSPGMLTRTLRENPDVLALRDHKSELLLGRTTANTLSLRVDSTGLAFTITLPKTNIGDDTAENVRLGNLSGCSFGFSCIDDSWAADADGNVVRTLLDVDLAEISITSFPAYQATSVSTRSCPVALRAKLKRDNADDQDCDPDVDDDCNPDANTEERCDCDCSACEDYLCSECTNEACEGDDDGCNDCGMMSGDNERSDTLRVRRLIAHRRTANKL
jgi:HK97 family phage prohead protease